MTAQPRLGVRYPAEHWVHLRTANPIESAFATLRLRTKVTKGNGSKAPVTADRARRCCH